MSGFKFALIGLAGVLLVGSCTRKEETTRAFASLDQARMKSYLVKQAEMITAHSLDGLDSREAIDARKAELRKKFSYMLGIYPDRKRTPLNAQVTGRLERSDYVVEKIVFESLPNFYVTGNLYIPKQGKGPYPAILYVCGHAINPYGAKYAYQHHGILNSRNGYVVFIVDPIQISEIYAIHHGVYSFDRWDWFSRGYNPSGVEVWTAMRALDYLETRPEVDPRLIGMTGRSGGGTMSWFTAALDERVKVVVTANATSTVSTHVAENLFQGHCDCAYFSNLYRFDWPTLAAMIAPRPLMLQNATRDPIYPPAGYKRVTEMASRIYRIYGVPERLKEVEIVAAHRDTSLFRLEALRWFNRWLLGKTAEVTEGTVERTPGDSLLVLDGRIPADACNPLIQEKFIPLPKLKRFRTLRELEKFKDELTVNLKECVFRNLPAERGDLNVRLVSENRLNNTLERRITLEPEPGIRLEACLYIPADSTVKLPAVLYIASPGEDVTGVRRYLSGIPGRYPDKYVALAIWPRGVGPTAWDWAFRRYVERSAYLMGETLDTMRLWDVLRGIDLITAAGRFNGRKLAVAGKGAMGIIGLYAGILDKRISAVILHNPTTSHNDRPLFLNVLRYTDIPTTAACFAPRTIRFIGHVPVAFRGLEEVYKLYGKTGEPRLAVNLYHAMGFMR